MEEPAALCANCGVPLRGEYCSACGERRLQRGQLRLGAFIGSAVEEVTDFEHSKLLHTLKQLVLRPGALTNEYLRGRRKSFVGPVRIYLVVFALSFLIYSIKGRASVYDLRTLVAADQSGVWQREIQKLAEKTPLSAPLFVDEVNARWQSYLPLTQALYPLSVACSLQLLFWRSRRYFAEHLIFALHFSAIALGINIVLWPLYAVIGLSLSTVYNVSILCSMLVIFVWLVHATRRVYGGSWWTSGVKALLVEMIYCLVGVAVSFLTLALAILRVVRAH